MPESINRKFDPQGLARFLGVDTVSDDKYKEYLQFVETGLVPDFSTPIHEPKFEFLSKSNGARIACAERTVERMLTSDVHDLATCSDDELLEFAKEMKAHAVKIARPFLLPGEG